MTTTPCAHLIEGNDNRPAHCEIGRGYPRACQGCAAYSAGLTLQERLRAQAWAATFTRPPEPPKEG